MKETKSSKRIRGRQALLVILSLALIGICAFYVYFIWFKSTDNARQSAIELAETAKSSLSIEDISELSGNTGDLGNPAYTNIQNDLMRIKANSGGVHTVYLLVQKSGTLFYLANSEPSVTDNYVYPGQAYSQSSEDARAVFSSGASVMTNVWLNEWISVLVPVADAQTGAVIAVFGMNYPADVFRGEITRPVFHAAAMIIVILLLLYTLYSTVKKNRKLRSMQNRLHQREVFFKTIFDQAPVGIAICQDKLILPDVNPMFETIVGRTKEELTGIEWPAYTHPDDLKADLLAFESMQAGDNDGYAMEKRYIRPDGSVVHTNINVVPLYLKGKADQVQPDYHLCIIQDITKRVETAQALLESERSKSVLLSNLPGLAYRCRYDRDWTLEFVSDGIKALIGYSPDEFHKSSMMTFYDMILPQYREAVWREWQRVLPLKKPFRYEYEVKTVSGEHKWVYDLGQGIYDKAGNIIAIEGIVVDISELRAREEKIQYLYDHDPLTGLYNRVYLDQKTEWLDQTGCLPLTHLVVDINGVRLINESFGHAEGDDLIKTVAGILRHCVRKNDVLARVGGDTFVMLMPHTGSKGAHKMRRTIIDACSEYNKTSSKPYDINVSLGYATRESLEQSMQQVMMEAEAFMRNRKLLNQRSSYNAVLSSIMATVYEKSHETEEHAQRIANLCRIVGDRLSLPDKSMGELLLFATLHDIGKIAVHDEILIKKEPLTDEEWKVLKKHPETGFRIAMSTPDLAPIADYILSHHERWDGTGYPQGLSGDAIPLLSRILAVADAYDAMTQVRSYSPAIPKQKALEEIKRNANTQFDPHIVNIFLQIMRESDEEISQEVSA